MVRRAVLRQRLEEHRALVALDHLITWPVDRIPHSVLIREAWPHRHNVSAYDAFYVAVAPGYDIPLLTADGPLTHSSPRYCRAKRPDGVASPVTCGLIQTLEP